MRFKRRYYCVEILFHDGDSVVSSLRTVQKLKHTQLNEALLAMIERLYGDYGMATMLPSFSVIYFNGSTNMAILRTSREMHQNFHTCLTYIQKLADYRVTLRVVHVSGSVKRCKKYLVNYCAQKVAELVNEQQKLKSGPFAPTSLEASEQIVQCFNSLAEACKLNDNTFIINKESNLDI